MMAGHNFLINCSYGSLFHHHLNQYREFAMNCAESYAAWFSVAVNQCQVNSLDDLDWIGIGIGLDWIGLDFLSA